ncbi:hypothetical protein AB0D14_42875 [Streptomyces sp. NPDC048484]|uniref:hypothetical protein n=1 Tax=Streptomyces sp. NPDC048484 TaxID=3155146 RepID=UPI0034455ED5
MARWQVVIAALIAALVPAVAAFALSAFGGKEEPPTPTKCRFPAVQLSAPDKAGSTFQTTAKLNCLPHKGTKYYLVAQLNNFGDPGTEHTVYCPRDPIAPGQDKKTYTTTRDIHESELHSKRALYYLKVTTDQEQELLANLQDDCAFELPAGVETVSNSVTVERAWK